jgi:hypothetical protein
LELPNLGWAIPQLGSTALPDAVPYQTATLDLSALSLTPSQSFTLTGIFAGGAPETSADIFFDNFVFEGNVTPIPEPVHYAMILFGLIAGGVGITRRLMRSRSQ